MMAPRGVATRFFWIAAALCATAPLRVAAQATAASSASSSSAPAAPTVAVVFAEKIHPAGVSNAGKISSTLYRGAQPAKQGFAELQKLGITTIVNLRDWHHEAESERRRVESLGMRYIHIPVSGWSPPTDEQVVNFLSLVQDSPGQKIFLHCHFGDDRTGVMIATYRIALQHWTAGQAIKEMYAFGFHYHWHPSMEAYVRRFPARFAADSVFAPVRPAPSKNCTASGQPAC